MTLKELRAKYAAKMAEMRAKINGEQTAETRTAFDALTRELDELRADIARADALETAEAEERNRVEAEERAQRAGRPILPTPGTGADERGSQTDSEQRAAQHRSAFATWIGTGNSSELRAMGTTTLPGGGFGIPVDMVREIEQAILTFGGVASSLRNWETPAGETIDWPLSNDTANAATIISENPAAPGVPEQDMIGATTPLNVSTLTTKLVLVSNQVLQDFQAANLSEFINQNLVERSNRGLSGYLINGSQDGNFDGLINVAVGATTAANNAIGLADIMDQVALMDPAYYARSKWVMNNATNIYLAGLRNPLGAPVFLPDANGKLTTLYGQPIVIDQSMPNMAPGAKPILNGDLSKYILRRVSGFGIRRLEERYAEYNQTGFVGFFRAGGRYLNAGTNPIQSLQMHA